MHYKRLIARMEIKGPNLVKGVQLEGLRVLGVPQDFSRNYYEHGIDELLCMDVVASLYQRNHLLDIIEKTAREIFVPLTVGGGLRTLEDISKVLRAGADKVALNTAAIRRPEFISEAANKFGSSTIVVSIEAIKKPDGSYEAFTDNGRELTGVEAVEWGRRAARLGAGEILVTSVDREGTGLGFDLELNRKIVEAVDIPVIACGGAGTLNHVDEVFRVCDVDAVCLSSMLHYHYLDHEETARNRQSEGNIDFVKNRQRHTKTKGADIAEIKEHLRISGIECRPAQVFAS